MRGIKYVIYTLCNRCADTFREDEMQTVERADPKQKVMGPCFLCGYKGFDYEVKDKKPHKK